MTVLLKPGLSTGHINPQGFLRQTSWGITIPSVGFVPLCLATLWPTLEGVTRAGRWIPLMA